MMDESMESAPRAGRAVLMPPDLIRVLIAGIAGVLLAGGTLRALGPGIRDEGGASLLFGLVFYTIVITAAAYRHAGAMLAAGGGAVTVAIGALSSTMRFNPYKDTLADPPTGITASVVLAGLLLGTGLGISLQRYLADSRYAQWQWRRILTGVALAVIPSLIVGYVLWDLMERLWNHNWATFMIFVLIPTIALAALCAISPVAAVPALVILFWRMVSGPDVSPENVLATLVVCSVLSLLTITFLGPIEYEDSTADHVV